MLVKECEIPLAGDEKKHKTILMAISSLVGRDSGGRLVGIVTIEKYANYFY